MRLTNRSAALLLASSGTLLMGISLITGHSARSEALRVLTPSGGDLSLDAWKAGHLRVAEPGTAFLDVRDEGSFNQYHVSFSTSSPGAGAKEIASTLDRVPAVVLVGSDDGSTKALALEVRATRPGARIYYIEGGAKAWYVAYDMPVQLFLEKPAPSGYASALATVKMAIVQPDPSRRAEVEEAFQALARLNVQPEFAKSKAKSAADGEAPKIAGGCG